MSMINIIGGSRYRVNKKALEVFVRNFLSQKNFSSDKTVNIVFMGKRKMRSIAAKYKHEDEALPVLAFPYHDEGQEDKLFGEVFLCYSQLVLIAAHRNKTVEEVIRQMVEHGLKNLFIDSPTPHVVS